MDYGASGKYGVAEIPLPSLQGCTLRGTQLPTCSEVLPTCSEVLPTCSDDDSTESNCYGFESSKVVISIHVAKVQMNYSGTAFLRSASSRRCVLCLMKTFVVEMLCHCNSFVLMLHEYSLRFSVDHGHDTYLLYLRTCSEVSVDHGVYVAIWQSRA